MKALRRRIACLLASLVVTVAPPSLAQAPETKPVSVVATPNPNVLPLLLALKREPQLPHGGLALRSATLNDQARQAQMRQLRSAHAAATDEINAARGNTTALWNLSSTISKNFKRHFGAPGLDLPTLALHNALEEERLVFHHARSVDAVRDDLARLLGEVLGRTIPVSFYR